MSRNEKLQAGVLFGSLLLLIGVLIGKEDWDTPQQTEPAAASVTESAVAPATPTIEELRHHALDKATRRLDAADREAGLALAANLQGVNDFFGDAKTRAPQFARAALSWGSKWRLVADWLPFTNGNRHREFLRAKFEEHLFAPQHLEAVVRQTITAFLEQLTAIENKLLVDLQADLKDLPIVIGDRDPAQLQAALTGALAQARDRIATGLKAELGVDLASLVAGEIMARVVVRLGVSSSILGVGAASGWASFGIGAGVGLVVDHLVGCVWDWWADPRGQLADELGRILVDLRDSLLDGDAEHAGLRHELAKHAQARLQAVRAAVVRLIENGGAP